jgi:hypothetical protein
MKRVYMEKKDKEQEILGTLTDENLYQYYSYPVEVKDLILKYFSPVFYNKVLQKDHLFSAFCPWYTIPRNDWPYNQLLDSTFAELLALNSYDEVLSEKENENLFNIKKYISSFFSDQKKMVFIQKLITT